MNDTRRSRVLVCVFLMSLAALALEVLQMRIFAFALWHHLAFLVISIALLGFAAAGAFLASVRRLQAARLDKALPAVCLLFSLSALLGPFFLARHVIDVFAQVGGREVLNVALYYVVFASPYFFAGYVISLALRRAVQAVGRLYFVNLLGSGVGCFLIFATLEPLGAEGTLFVIAALGGVAAWAAARGLVVKGLALALVVGLLAAAPFAGRVLHLRVASSKLMAQGLNTLEGRTLLSRWTPLCRLDVCQSAMLSDTIVFQDGDAPTMFPASTRPLGLGSFHSLPFLIRQAPSVLVIGVGGGLDVKAALDYGARAVTGVEINPVTLALCQDPAFNPIAEQMRSNPSVTLRQAEGRYFVRSRKETYDLIQMTGVDTYTALASGAYVLSESYLYTLEAFHDYLDHLSEDGIVAIIRFAFPVPRETLRIMVMGCRALAERGAREPWRHIAVLRMGIGEKGLDPFKKKTGMGAILICRRPFTAVELDRFRLYAERFGLIKDYLPGEPGKFSARQLAELHTLVGKEPAFRSYRIDPSGMNPFHAFARALAAGRPDDFLDSYPYDVRPVRDDAPFFFNQHRWSALWRWLRGTGGAYAAPAKVPWAAMTVLFQTRPLGLILLFLTLVQLAVLCALCIFAPLYFLRRTCGRGAALAPMAYFLCLGLGYMLLMISAMQRFGLILGHPTYAISVTMATFLIASGLGSLTSERFPWRGAAALLAVVAAVLAGSTALMHVFLPAITRTALAWPFSLRVSLTVAVISPMAFFMGMCFPTGLRLLGHLQPARIPWAYGVNGAATVLGSVLAVCLALALGFARVQWIAAALYVLAAALMARMVRQHRAAERSGEVPASEERG